jgi:hypothetical protein
LERGELAGILHGPYWVDLSILRFVIMGSSETAGGNLRASDADTIWCSPRLLNGPSGTKELNDEKSKVVS